MAEEQKPAVLEVYPIGKIKRILMFLADYFLSFILGLFIFSFAVFPLGKLTSNYDKIAKDKANSLEQQLNLLYAEGLLFYEGEEKGTFSANLITSADKFIAYQVNPNLTSDNVFYTYYVGMKEDKDSLTEAMKCLDPLTSATEGKYFTYQEKDLNGLPKMQKALVEEFKPVTDPKDSLGEAAQKDYDSFVSGYFTALYQEMIATINASSYSDSSAKDAALSSYPTLTQNIKAGERSLNLTIEISASLAYLISNLLYFLLWPIIVKRGRTPSMMVMKIERLESERLIPLSIGEVVIQFVFSLLFCLSYLLFLPAGYIQFTSLFGLADLFIVSLLSLLLGLISLGFLLFGSFNKTLVDFLSKTSLLGEESYDDICKARGKEID
ncbi:MAG: RDD family protein [Bacilli bacterium]|jgi:cell division protein FtsB|nr:RDD family protein [Bacilli bacterium]